MSRPSFWPDTNQTVLLHAVLDEPEPAKAAIERWLASIDFDAIDAGSQRLVPLLQTRLQQMGIDHPLAPRIKGIFRRNWYLDQRLRRQLRIIRLALHEAGIECILLKGAALGLTVYGHGALRPADDIDLLVRRGDFDRTVELLIGAGWRPEATSKHARSFRSDIGSVDLHVSPFRETAREDAIEPLWTDKAEAMVDGAPAGLLSPHDQLLQTLTHGMQANSVPPIRWITDAVLVIRHHGAALDWDRFIQRAEQLDFALVASRGLAYLRTEFDAPIPRSVVDRLKARRKRLAELIEYHCGRKDRFKPLAKWALTYRDTRDVSLATRWRMVAREYYLDWDSPEPSRFVVRSALRLVLGRRLTA